jgi:hypothetical protein
MLYQAYHHEKCNMHQSLYNNPYQMSVVLETSVKLINAIQSYA